MNAIMLKNFPVYNSV